MKHQKKAFFDFKIKNDFYLIINLQEEICIRILKNITIIIK